MADKTGIQWTHATWNPVVGCSVLSPGCTNCYAMKMADRLAAMAPQPDGKGNPHLIHYQGLTSRDPTNRGYDWSKPVWTGVLKPAPEHILTQPLRWKRPSLIFVNSMSDLFHEAVPDALIDRVFAVMALSPQHTFQVLTKRSARMRHYLSHIGNRADLIAALSVKLAEATSGRLRYVDGMPNLRREMMCKVRSPLPNVWLGVSAEDQRRADERVPDLLATPAAVRFVSAEPLLGPIDFHDWFIRAANGFAPALDWIIVGGESGPGARPMRPAWARSIRDQCAAAGVPYFFKQWGAWAELTQSDAADEAGWQGRGDWMILSADGTLDIPGHRWPDGSAGEVAVVRVGKKAAGRLLAGVEHNGMPEVRA